MKVYLALTRPKLKRGAEWKLTAINGLLVIAMVLLRHPHALVVDFYCGGDLLLAGPVAVAPGGQARPAMDGSVCALNLASIGPRTAWLCLHPAVEAQADSAQAEEMDAVKPPLHPARVGPAEQVLK